MYVKVVDAPASPSVEQTLAWTVFTAVGFPVTKGTTEKFCNSKEGIDEIKSKENSDDQFTVEGLTWHAYCDGSTTLTTAAAVAAFSVAYINL